MPFPAVARQGDVGDITGVSDEPKEPPKPRPEPAILTCPTCGGAVDPRRTAQALSREKRLLLFCSSGCLRQFLAAERKEP